MTLKSVGHTANFEYFYQDSLTDAAVAKSRAQYFLSSAFCETDLATLESWFGVSGGFGSGNRIQVHIDRSDSLGSNHGYQTGGKTTIQVAPFDGGPSEPTAQSEAQCRSTLVAELSEVLMDYRNQKTGVTTWGAGNSMGEGLSEVCEGLLHPDGYYTPGLGPRIADWLNASPRPNWVDNVEPTDQHSISYGCSALFIYFLHSQLRFSMTDIITNAGTSLGETYELLSGAEGGWAAFTTLLDTKYPPGTSYSPTTDDLFPINAPFGVLKSLSVAPNRVIGGNPSTGTVTLESRVTTDTLVSLSVVDKFTGNPGHHTIPAVASLPRSIVTVPAGALFATFTINTSPVKAPQATGVAAVNATAVVTKSAPLTTTA